MIEARGLTKRFGQVVAVDGLTFSVRPGQVTPDGVVGSGLLATTCLSSLTFSQGGLR